MAVIRAAGLKVVEEEELEEAVVLVEAGFGRREEEVEVEEGS